MSVCNISYRGGFFRGRKGDKGEGNGSEAGIPRTLRRTIGVNNTRRAGAEFSDVELPTNELYHRMGEWIDKD